MDQHSFEQGLLLGLETAIVCIERAGGLTHVQAIRAQIAEVEGMIERNRTGKRVMVEYDIFLRMPVMTAADLYGVEEGTC